MIRTMMDRILTNLNVSICVIALMIAVCFPLGNVAMADELQIVDGETLTFEITPEEGEPYLTTSTYYVKEENGEVLYSYTNVDKNASWDVTTDTQALPRKIVFAKKDNKVELNFDQQGKVEMVGEWNGKKVHETATFRENVTLENMLIIRTFDLQSTEKYEFDLLRSGKIPDLKHYPMTLEVVGEEEVTVPAGTFQCKKVLFTLADWRSSFYKGYYYVTDDEHRYVVKMENLPQNGSTVLQKIEHETLTQNTSQQ